MSFDLATASHSKGIDNSNRCVSLVRMNMDTTLCHSHVVELS